MLLNNRRALNVPKDEPELNAIAVNFEVSAFET
ncbi:Uncharacterised protein [Acinetobacter baumannii]|nr:Uncharacterised protein [Acinetobacter baumannii]